MRVCVCVDFDCSFATHASFLTTLIRSSIPQLSGWLKTIKASIPPITTALSPSAAAAISRWLGNLSPFSSLQRGLIPASDGVAEGHAEGNENVSWMILDRYSRPVNHGIHCKGSKTLFISPPQGWDNLFKPNVWMHQLNQTLFGNFCLFSTPESNLIT